MKIKINRFCLNRFFVVTCLSLLTLTAPSLSLAKRVLLDQVIATVNSEAITAEMLDARLTMIKQQLAQQGTTAPDDKLLKKQVLDHMIDESLQLQLAKNMGVSIDDQSLNDAIINIAQQNGLNLKQFRDALAKDGYDYNNFRNDLKNEMTIQRVQQRVLAPEVVITERELNQLVERLKLSEAENEQYHINHILIALPENPTTEDLKNAQAKITNIQQEMKAGKQFNELSVAYSDGQQALQGGDLGWRKRSELPALFADKVQTMQPNEVAGPLRNASGFHLIQFVAKRSSAPISPVTKTKVRHILLQNTEQAPAHATKKRLQALRQRISKGESFAELAKAYSDDRMSAEQGGDIGWITPGKTDPAFEKIMDQTKKDEISPVFESPFGWHILQVMDRQETDLTDEHRREQANAQLFERKLQEAQLGWLSQLRDQAHVVINKL